MPQSKTSAYLATGLLVGGFVLIVLGWNGAASLDFVQGQLPFLLSGGLAGLGLIVGGAALALVNEQRKQTAAVLERLDRVVAVLRQDAVAQDDIADALPRPREARGDGSRIVREEVGAS